MKKGMLVSCIALVALLSAYRESALAADVTLAWDAVTASTLAGYKVYYGSTSHTYGAPIVVGNVTGYTISGLQPGTYFFAVTAYDNSNVETSYSNEATATVTPQITAVNASIVQTTSATVTWKTDVPSNSQVVYGTTTAYGSSTPLDTGLVTSHLQNLAGLAASTTYHYKVQSGAGGVLSASADNAFTTLTPPTPPPAPSLTISGTAASAVTTSGATIAWTTSLPADSQVFYGLTTAYGSSSPLNPTLVTSHTVNLSGLAAGATYHFIVQSSASGSTATSTDGIFTTSSPSPTSVVISGVSASGITASKATIKWMTNLPSNCRVDFGTTTALGTLSPATTELMTSHAVTLTGLAPKRTYYYRVTSGGTASGVYSFRTRRR